jgi:hypothetical protein
MGAVGLGKTIPVRHIVYAQSRSMIYNRFLTVPDVADYLQMSEYFVLTEIQRDYLDSAHTRQPQRPPAHMCRYVFPNSSPLLVTSDREYPLQMSVPMACST